MPVDHHLAVGGGRALSAAVDLAVVGLAAGVGLRGCDHRGLRRQPGAGRPAQP